MISKSIIEKLREIYQSLPKVELIDKGDGWVNQYDLLRAVGKVGINYKNLGYEHFYEFLTDSGLFSFWTEATTSFYGVCANKSITRENTDEKMKTSANKKWIVK